MNQDIPIDGSGQGPVGRERGLAGTPRGLLSDGVQPGSRQGPAGREPWRHESRLPRSCLGSGSLPVVLASSAFPGPACPLLGLSRDRKVKSTFWELGDLGVPFRFLLLTWERQFTKSVMGTASPCTALRGLRTVSLFPACQ